MVQDNYPKAGDACLAVVGWRTVQVALPNIDTGEIDWISMRVPITTPGTLNSSLDCVATAGSAFSGGLDFGGSLLTSSPVLSDA